MSATPLISVVLSVYNGERYLREALESISAQTFAEFEMIVVDDGSTDATADVLAGHASRDPRLQVERLPRNQGTAAAVNHGLTRARGKYIARMDADDICRPDRFEKQARFLEAHPQIGLLGSAIILIDQNGRRLGRQVLPTTHEEIMWSSLIANPFAQPTMMLRRQVLAQHQLTYRPLQAAEDYDLWVRMLQFTQGANLADSLVLYRVHAASASSVHQARRGQWHAEVSYDHLRRRLPEFKITPDQQASLVLAIHGLFGPDQRDMRPAAAGHYIRLWKAYSHGRPQIARMTALRRQTAVRAAKIGLFPLFRPGWLQVALDLYKVDPLWPLYVLFDLPEMIRVKRMSLRLQALRGAA